MYLPAENGADRQEQAVLREWEYVQESLFTFALTISAQFTSNQRLLIDHLITSITRGCAKLWWVPYTHVQVASTSQVFEVRYRNIHYGMLELAAGYLVSPLQPRLPQQFARLCALVIALTEHEAFVQQQTRHLIPLLTPEATKPLSRREQDILRGFLKGESQAKMAQRLGVEKATIHSHIQGLYTRLHVHDPREAIVRIFELRLVGWLDFPHE